MNIKKIILSTVSFFFSVMMMAQNPYYDALYLSSFTLPDRGNNLEIYVDQDNIRQLEEVFRRYGLQGNFKDDKALFTAMEKLLDNTENPFIAFKGYGENNFSDKTIASKSEVVESTLPSGIGAFNVSTISDGLAKFLVKRTKQELSLAFFEKFKMVVDSTEGLSELFPKTKAVLGVIDTEIYMYANYLNTMREAFETDLQNLLSNLESYLDGRTVYDQEIKKKVEYFQAALLMINNVKAGVHPADAIAKLGTKSYMSTPLVKVQSASQLFSVFSSSLRSSKPNQYWVTSSELQLLLKPNTFKIYLGLIYQIDGDQEVFGNKLSTYLDKVASSQEGIKKYESLVRTLIDEAEQVDLAINELKSKKSTEEKIATYKDLFKSTVRIFNNFDDFKDVDVQFTLDSQSIDVVKMMGLANDTYTAVAEQNYSELILNVSLLLTEVLDEEDWIDDFVKYGTFIANVAKADNSDEVADAIESVALPVGSASIKKNVQFNVSLNSYVGLAPGYEYSGETGEGAFTFGVFTPVGIAFNWGKQKCKGKAASVEKSVSNSLFLSVVDITSFSTFRFQDSETAELPEVSLSNIFAPGLYYVRGMNKVPVSWGLGAQLGPQLRELSDEMATVEDGVTVSAKFFIAVDIPLINFYTKTR